MGGMRWGKDREGGGGITSQGLVCGVILIDYCVFFETSTTFKTAVINND